MLSQRSVEDWLDANPEAMQDYFLRKADIELINRWLLKHGFQTLQDYINCGVKVSLSPNSGPSSPNDVRYGETFFNSKHNRSNSKKHLRQDYAKSKFKNMFRTYEPGTAQDVGTGPRRSSLKDMRMFRSLPPSTVNMLSLLIQSKVRLPRYPSKDIDLKREMRHRNEREFFMEIVKEIANDLDLLSLSEKMMVNVSILVDGDRSSVFVIEGKNTPRPSLISKIFDVHAGTHVLPSTSANSCVRVPWGKGIIGHVAETGEVVNLKEASVDERYNDEVDRITGYKTKSLLCMPIKNGDDEIVGVAQVINKTSEGAFSKEDEKLLTAYLTFCGIAIYNAQIFDAYSKEYERNKALLEVVHDLFEEQTSLDNVISKIMQRAQTLLKCERCSVLLKDPNTENSFHKVFELGCQMSNDRSAEKRRQRFSSRKMDDDHGVCCFQRFCTCSRSEKNDTVENRTAELVLITGETINFSEAIQDPRFDQLTEQDGVLHIKSILSKPIRRHDYQIIGVAQIINKLDGLPFDEHDDQLFELFTIFCGLGINNASLYEDIAIASAKQTVALEMLSYHASVESDDVIRMVLRLMIRELQEKGDLKINHRYQNKRVPEADELRLGDLKFNDFALGRDDMVLAAIRIFYDLGLMRTCSIDHETLVRWMLTVRKNYRNVAYHNWRHAFNVCQVIYATMKNCKTQRLLSDREILALIVACLCHDLDHRGTNNAFQHKTSSALAQLYGTKATLENHHFNHALMILNSEGHNIFINFSSEEYSELISLLKHAILATDLSLHLQIRQKFFAMTEQGDSIDWDDRDIKEIFRSILMTTCDIAAITKPWEVSRRVADLVMTEFFDQGDKEREELKIQPQAHMDREKQDELPKLQLGWIDGICLPLYKHLVLLDPSFKPMLDGILENRALWEELDIDRLTKQASIDSAV